MSYDNSVTYLEATRFKEYKFLQITDVESVIRQIPEESPYIDIVACDEEPLPKGRPLTKKELSKLNKEAKLLNITNNRKAKNIAKYILDNFDRTLVDTLDPDTTNCLFKSVPVQLSNVRFMFNETQQYTAQNLRLQVVYFMAINYEFMYPQSQIPNNWELQTVVDEYVRSPDRGRYSSTPWMQAFTQSK